MAGGEYTVVIYRQGDVVLRPATIPGDAMEAEHRIEVKSETGHAHVIKGKVYVSGKQQYIMLDRPTPIEHPEHETLVIPPGTYQVDTVRSYVPIRNLD